MILVLRVAVTALICWNMAGSADFQVHSVACTAFLPHLSQISGAELRIGVDSSNSHLHRQLLARPLCIIIELVLMAQQTELPAGGGRTRCLVGVCRS